MPFSLHLNSRTAEVAAELQKALDATGDDLAPAALTIARVEYPSLDPKPYAVMLDRMGEEAAKRLSGNRSDSLRAFNEYLYDELGFVGNRTTTIRATASSNEVLIGAPAFRSARRGTLEVARRAGLHVDGVNPGHFLLRARDGITTSARSGCS